MKKGKNSIFGLILYFILKIVLLLTNIRYDFIEKKTDYS